MHENIDDAKFFELIEGAKNGDKYSQAYLVEKNIGLVWSIVKKFNNRGHDLEDIFQIGSIGLIKAINKFDTSYNVKFSTYAVPMIIGEIKRFLRDDGIIKVSRSLKEISNRARVIKEIMTKELGRDPTINEISQRLDIKPEELVMAFEAGTAPESLYSTYGDGESQIQLIERIDGESLHREMELIDKLALQEIINLLEPRERQIIVLRYFKEKTQVQIAKMLGISQVQVSRIEKKILEDIRKKISNF